MDILPYRFEGDEEIPSPQLVYYRPLIEKNIDRMIGIAGGPERLWPHMKTYKMSWVLRILKEKGIDRVKCATVAEAELAAMTGMSRALIAYTLVGPNILRFLKLCRMYPETCFYAIADDTEQVKALSGAAAAESIEVDLLIDVDMGLHRTGVLPERIDELYREWDVLPNIHVRGMHCYDGNRHENDLSERSGHVAASDLQVEAIKQGLLKDGYDCSVIVMGGTPSFPCHAAQNGEYLSPGTCVVQDAGYAENFRDLEFEYAAVLLTRVISSVHKDTITLDLGTKAVASDPSPVRAVLLEYPEAETVLQNEEHWVVRLPEGTEKPSVGTLLHAVPIHICPTTILYPEVPVVEDGRVLAWCPVEARDRKINI